MATSTPSNLKKEINEGILRTYLGVEDASDIDFETYRTLLKEKLLLSEWVAVKWIVVTFHILLMSL